ncbi:MAG: diaminopimelate decarboxylase [Pseudomonadota bacterium]|nr:diaminopimelate decarboxylase [Pseudomonadota bacterium]
MDHFHYRDGELYAEDVSVAALAEAYGTPCYLYSKATLERHYRAFDEAFAGHPHLICYAVKANSNLAVLDVLARLGAGFDIVSVGELERVLAAGGDPRRVVFSGVGKRLDEIERALEVGVHCFNVESAPELERIEAVARAQGTPAPVSIRVNPDVDAQTHPYIATGLAENKFGVDIPSAEQLYAQAANSAHLLVRGVDCHIGSQLTQLAPFSAALDRMLALIDELEGRGIAIEHLDFGGGLGVRYQEESPPDPGTYVQALLDRIGPRPLQVILEPGRAIAANAGVLITRVEYLKHTPARNFAVVDAAMNDLMRPTLYQAWQAVWPVQPSSAAEGCYDVVGPVCESGDFLAKSRDLALETGSLLAVRSAGAYGFTMASNYNTRPRAAEVMVSGGHHQLVRQRETVQELFANESRCRV